MQPPVQNNENVALDELLHAVEQEEIAWANGEELPPPLEGHSSITTTVSLSEGAFSHASEEVNQVVPQQQVVGDGLQMLMQAYPEEDMHEHDLPPILLVAEVEPAATLAEIIVAPVAVENVAIDVVVTTKEPIAPVLNNMDASVGMLPQAVSENAQVSAEPWVTLNNAPIEYLQMSAPAAAPVDHMDEAHVNTTRGSLNPVANLEGLSIGKEGNWVEQIQEHFNFEPSLLGLKNIQLNVVANKETAISEEGLMIWKKHFAEKSLDGSNSLSLLASQ